MPAKLLSKESAESQTALLRLVILGLIGVVGFSIRLFSVVRFESIIHEFDPWFNFRSTKVLVEQGWYEFWNWFDELAWYPLGRVVGGTVYPGIMATSGAIYQLLHLLHIPINIREVCVFLAPVFSAFTAYATFKLTSEIKDERAGLLAAIFIAIAPGYISRSVAGSYDNEGIAIYLLMFTFYLWVKASKTGSTFYATACALFYFYMVSAWGGYVFIINLIPLHAFTLLLMGRFSSRLYTSYSTFYAIGTLASMNIPFVGFQPTFTSEHMAALGVFGLLQLVAFARFVESFLGEKQFRRLLYVMVAFVVVAAFAALIALTFAGVVAPWTGRFYSLWDTEYARKYIPIISSVSEHQPTAWTSFFNDMQLLVPLFPAGLYFCFRELKDEHVFIILYGILGSYFAGVMIRLILTLTPVVCICAALAVSYLLDTYVDFRQVKGEAEGKLTIFARLAVLASMMLVLSQFVYHCTYITSSAYSSPSVVLASTTSDGQQRIIDDFREAYYWLRMNTPPDAKIASWWDYGYQIAGFSNRTTMVDNNTWNNTHIATIGKMMSSTEDVAYQIMQRLDIDYVLVIFGSVLGYSGDDINKFLWMIRIGEGVYPNDIDERKFFTDRGEYRVDKDATPTMRNSLMYKLSYYRFVELFGGQEGWDRVRNQGIPNKPISLTVVDEAFTSENMIVRIYKVKKPDNLGRPLSLASGSISKRRSNKMRSRKG